MIDRLRRKVLWGVVGRSESLCEGVGKDVVPIPYWPIVLCALRIVRGVVVVDAESDSKLPPSVLSYGFTVTPLLAKSHNVRQKASSILSQPAKSLKAIMITIPF